MTAPYKPPGPRGNLLRLGVDLDGTLAAPVWTPENPTSEIGAPLLHNVAKVRKAHEQGLKIWVHTARPDTDYENIEGWLIHHEIPFNEIRTGKPLFLAYVDDRAVPADAPDWTQPYSHLNTICEVLDVLEEYDDDAASWLSDELVVRGLL